MENHEHLYLDQISAELGGKFLIPEKLRHYPGCENLSDEECISAIDSLEKLSVLIYYHLQNIDLDLYEKDSQAALSLRDSQMKNDRTGKGS